MNTVGISALTLAAALAGAVAHADNYLSPTEERVRLSLGFEYLSSDTNFRIDSSSGVPGTPINAENQFGLEKKDFEPKFQAMVRVGERNTLRFDYFTLDRSGGTTVTEPIVFRDVVLQPNDPLQSNLSMRLLSITYGFSFLHGDRYEVAATLGVNITDISARAQVQTPLRHVDQTDNAAGPFPTVGLYAMWVVSKRFYVDARAQYLKVNVDDLNGSLGIYELNALYRLRPNIAFAFGYTEIRANLVSMQSKQSGLFNFNSKGPEAFVRVSF